ncbi:activator of Hsp90 ATPase, putative, partial [Hepatocystis sp. ex Piliocolobus tephrosceles]
NKELKKKEEEEEKMQNVKIINNNKITEHNTVDQNIINKMNGNNDNGDENQNKGSVWNVNSYHWEEKCLTNWAKIELKNMFDKTNIELCKNIHLEFFDTQIEGEASSSLRKKKKILVYDLKVNSEWKACKKNKNNEIEIEVKGGIVISEIVSDYSIEDKNKYNYNFVFDNQDTPEYRTTNDVIKSEVPSKIDKLIDDFILKMREK